MAKPFNLEILTPERTFFSGQAESLVVPTIAGEMGVLADCASIVTALVPGEIFFRVDGECKYAANSDGFMEIRDGEAFVFCQTVFWPEEMDEDDLHSKEERQKAALSAAQTRKEYALSHAALSRTFAKIKVKKTIDQTGDKH